MSNSTAPAPIPSPASHRRPPSASGSPGEEQQGHPQPPAGKSGGTITPIQAARHIHHARRPAPSRASLVLAAVGVVALAGAAVMAAIALGLFA
ncbi:MAG: hypothetical protein EPN98_21325 [Phenylobacterium sp.]|nr:MAG: hypothetical protein EPN98_21325 [Phenylobacterium sp.]